MKMPMRIIVAMLAGTSISCHAQSDEITIRLERLAKADNAEAIYHLGMMHHLGIGLPQDMTKALAAFRRAAALGDPLASYKLGCYYDGQGGDVIAPDPALALKYKLIAANAGYALAQQDVGLHYVRIGDVPTGLAWLERSASQGWSDGMMALPAAYNVGEGVPRDPAKTAAYFKLVLARTEPNEKQVEWLEAFEAKMPPAERKRAQDIVSNFRPHPSLLTMKALSGDRAARELIAKSGTN